MEEQYYESLSTRSSSTNTYLIVSNTLELFIWDVLADGWHAERAMPVLIFPHNIPAVGFHRFSKIVVWDNLCIIWLSMDASGGIPRVLTLHILNTMDEIRSSVRLALPKILTDAQHVVCDGLMILNCLFNNHCFWEVFLQPLVVQGHGSTVEYLLLAVAEAVLRWIELPFVVSRFLLARVVVAVRLLVHLVHLFVLADECSAHWVDHFFR